MVHERLLMSHLIEALKDDDEREQGTREDQDLLAEKAKWEAELKKSQATSWRVWSSPRTPASPQVRAHLRVTRIVFSSGLSLPKTSCTASEAASEHESEPQSGPVSIAIQDVAMGWITLLLALVNALLADRSRLALENVALRQQVAVLKRSVKRAKIHDSDRVFWVLMRRMLDSWRDTLLVVKPETVINCHRKGWRYYWHRKCRRGTPGRPKIDLEVIELIRRMSRDNATWGAPRIHSELALLGYDIAESTVDKYLVRHPKTPSQGWRTFLANHMSVTAACDFFVVPTVTFSRCTASSSSPTNAAGSSTST